jgi:predicted RNA methylase
MTSTSAASTASTASAASTASTASTASAASKLYYLLGQDYRNWSCADEQYYSYITPHIIMQKIIDLAKEHHQGLLDKVIWDMFAGIGSDGLRLALQTGKVICTEIDDDRFKDLQKNYAVLGCNNVQLIHGDCCDSDTNCDIVYFDPPWGDTFRSGRTFNFSDVILSNGKCVLDLAIKIHQKHKMIIKAPIMCNSFEDAFESDSIKRIFTFTQQKLKFLFVDAKTKSIDHRN